jgi:hypothetical protein
MVRSAAKPRVSNHEAAPAVAALVLRDAALRAALRMRADQFMRALAYPRLG